MTQADVAHRAFAAVCVLRLSLLYTASAGTHPHDLLQEWLHMFMMALNGIMIRESEAHNSALQKQLDGAIPR